MATNGTHDDGPMSGAARLRKLIAKPNHTIMAAGVYDGITARLALAEKFECLYMTGAGTAASVLGMPDLGIANLSDMVQNAGMIASLDRTVPVIADADTGYGESLAVARTVRAYMAAGVAGFHIEDQVMNKRCGHLAGKEIVSDDAYFKRIRAAAAARDELRAQTGMDIVIIARTDSMQSLGYEAAVERLRGAIKAGAEVAFLEGITAMDQMERVTKDLDGIPVLLNMVAGGVTPDLSLDEANKLGFKIVIFPNASFNIIFEAAQNAYRELKATGRTPLAKDPKLQGPKAFFEAMGLQQYIDFDQKLGGLSYNNGV